MASSINISLDTDNLTYRFMERTADGTVRDITDELPFDVPDTWEWVRLNNLGDVGSSKRVFTSEFVNKGIPFYRGTEIGALAEGHLNDVKHHITLNHYHDLIYHTGKPCIGDLLLSSICADGRVWRVDTNDPFYFKDGRVLWIHFQTGFINSQFIQLALKARLLVDYANIASGTTFAELKIFLLKVILIPMPPIAEQRRIVECISELFPCVADYDAVEQKLTTLNSSFSDQLKKSILQAAVQGKLVPQDENDEPANILLERIHAEREQLIREGKIKRGKHESIIFRRDNSHYELQGEAERCIDDELPFEIPETWVWARLDILCEYIQRGKSPKYSPIKKYPVIAQKCNQWSGFNIEKAQFIEPDSLKLYASERILQDNDLMWNSTGLGTLGRMAIYKNELNPYELAVADSHVTVIRPLKNYVLPEYLITYFANPTVQTVIESKSDGTTKQKELATATIKSYYVPLPPFKEQKRIVARIDAVLPLLNSL